MISIFDQKLTAFVRNFVQNEYYDDLSKTAGIANIRPVITKMHKDTCLRFMDDLVNFRKDVYRIIDDENFIKITG